MPLQRPICGFDPEMRVPQGLVMESVQEVLSADAEELAKAEGHLNKWLAEYLHERAAVRRMPAVPEKRPLQSSNSA